MIEKLFNELINYQERMHRKSKARFREYLKEKAKEKNLPYYIYPETFASKNVVIGNLKTAKYILGVHYDTPPRLPSILVKNLTVFNIVGALFFPFLIFIFSYFEINLIYALSIYLIILLHLMGIGIANKKNYNDNTSGVLTLLLLMEKLKRDDVCYVFFDNEEKGLIGSLQLATSLKRQKGYKAYSKIYINFDCVGRGEVFGIVAFNKAKQIANKLIEINEDKAIEYVIRKRSIFEGSDHFSFKNWNSLGIMCYNRKGKKLYLNNIHSNKDNYINLNNISSLVNTITKYLDEVVEANG